jgi:hypothetical protein
MLTDHEFADFARTIHELTVAQALLEHTLREHGEKRAETAESHFQALVTAAYSNWKLSNPDATVSRTDAERILRQQHEEREREHAFQRRLDAVWGDIAADDPGVTRGEVEKILRRIQ